MPRVLESPKSSADIILLHKQPKKKRFQNLKNSIDISKLTIYSATARTTVSTTISPTSLANGGHIMEK
jgi:hypothetical protein